MSAISATASPRPLLPPPLAGMPSAIGSLLAWVAMLGVVTRLGMASFWANAGEPGIVVVQLVQAVGLAGVAVLWFRQPPRNVDRAVVLFSGWLLLGGMMSDLQLPPDATRVVRFLLIVSATCFFVERPRWLAVLAALAVISWGVPTLRGLSPENAPTIAMGLVVACLAGTVLHLARRRIVALEAEARDRQRILELEIARRERLQEEVVADRKLESLTLMSAGVAHDLNNLLGPMLGCTESAWQGADRDAREDLDVVLSACAEARRLCEGLLDHTGVTVRAMGIVPLARFIEESRALLERCAEGSELVLDVHRVSRCLSVSMSSSALGRVLVNLVANAAQAMAERKGVIHIAASLDESMNSAVIEVIDEGKGIRPEDLGRIFDPFYTTRREGKGLGLSSVHGLVRAHGGSIEVESAVGQGTRMRVLLPIAPA